jgi:uncharacterized protein YjiS (DUF1127 family)
MSRLYEEHVPSLLGNSAHPGSFGVSKAFRVLNRYLVQPLLAAHRARVTYLELSSLDDRQLADIGLNRGAIESALTGRAPISAASEAVSEPQTATRSRAA